MRTGFILLFFLAVVSGFSQETDYLLPHKDTVTSFCCYTLKLRLGEDVVHYRIYEKKDSVLTKEYTEVNNLLHGSQITYYSDGQIESFRTYLLGIPVGAFTEYYPNGIMKSFYDFGYSPDDIYLPLQEFIVEYETPYPPYNIVTEISMCYKPLNGSWYYYYDTGSIQRIEHYSSNKLNGKTIYYDPDGQVLKEEEYLHGELQEQ